MPFDTAPEWPAPLAASLTEYRAAWRAKMDAVNACIQANAEMEELVDKPVEVPGLVRVSGPFTVEGVIAREHGLDVAEPSPVGGEPEELEAFESDGAELSTANAEAHLDKIIRLLKASGVDFAANKNLKFTRLEPLNTATLIHAEGAWPGEADERRVAVSIGPEVGNITAFQVEEAMRSANRRGYDDVVFAAFGFDAAAQAAIDEEGSHPNLRLHMALIRPDVAMGELLKTQPGSQLFTVFSAPRVKAPVFADGEWTVEVEGMDVYDPVSHALYPTNRERVAAWFLDSDYDGRTFCITQAFFPDKKKWEKLAKALGDKGVLDASRFEVLTGFVSLPFTRPPNKAANVSWRVAVKVIDPRGNEGLRVVLMPSEKY